MYVCMYVCTRWGLPTERGREHSRKASHAASSSEHRAKLSAKQGRNDRGRLTKTYENRTKESTQNRRTIIEKAQKIDAEALLGSVGPPSAFRARSATLLERFRDAKNRLRSRLGRPRAAPRAPGKRPRPLRGTFGAVQGRARTLTKSVRSITRGQT